MALWYYICRFFIHTLALEVRALGLFNKYINKKKIDIDSIVGQRCFVVDRVDNYAGCGQVRVNGQYWAARASSDEDVYEEGEFLRIIAIEGVKLICRK